MGISKRAVQSNATCTSNFSWMFNSLNQSPCIVAGYLQAQCASGNWDIGTVTPSTHYTPPDGGATQCQCSWATYNAIQACANCQLNGGNSSVISWAQYSTNCTKFLPATSYFPENIQIPAETAIPYWAIQNVTTWINSIFNASEALSFASLKKNDTTQDNRDGLVNTNGTIDGGNGGGGQNSTTNDGSGGKRSNVGAIAGGVVGGVIGLVILCLLAFLFWRRKRLGPQLHPAASIHSHSRSTSDGTVQGYYQPTYKNQHFSPSPEPTLPVSYNHTGYGVYPYDVSLLTSAPDILAISPVHKNLTGQTLPTVSMNMTSITPTISNAEATLNSTQLSSTATRNENEPEEGSIQPFILPPNTPSRSASMDVDGDGKAGRNSPIPRIDGKPGRSSPVPVGSHDVITRLRTERQNPPSYSELVEAPDVTLSGTTLRQGASSTADTQTRRASNFSRLANQGSGIAARRHKPLEEEKP